MAKYVALLRGIGPSNPNMHGTKLAGVATDLGLSNARSFISSGNVLFESGIKDIPKLEKMFEEAWPKKLGFKSTTIIRSQVQLQALVDADPYKGSKHGNISSSYLLVTFFKQPPKRPPKRNYYSALGVNALCSTIDNSANLKTPDFMAQLDKQLGKDQITSRTWNTIQRLLQKMD